MDLAEPKLPDVSSMPPARLEAACTLIGVYCGPKVNDGQIRDELADIADFGFLGDDTGPVGCVLIRAEDDEDLAWRVGELRRQLSAPSWVAVTGQRGTEIREGRAEVRHVAAIAVASGRPPGLYRATATVRGAKIDGGWIVLPGGKQVGVVERDGTPSAAPEIDPETGAVTIDGQKIVARPVTP